MVGQVLHLPQYLLCTWCALLLCKLGKHSLCKNNKHLGSPGAYFFAQLEVVIGTGHFYVLLHHHNSYFSFSILPLTVQGSCTEDFHWNNDWKVGPVYIPSIWVGHQWTILTYCATILPFKTTNYSWYLGNLIDYNYSSYCYPLSVSHCSRKSSPLVMCAVPPVCVTVVIIWGSF